jgi:hypothetical protein
MERVAHHPIAEEVAMSLARPRSAPLLAALALLVAASASSAVTSDSGPARLTSQAAVAECPPFPGADAFVDRIDNRYLPLFPGAIYIYKGSEDGEEQRNVVEVTHETKSILGVDAVVVRDTVSDSDGELIEQTLDWFAQDESGNVWYLGEDSKDYENGEVVSTEGSWEAGVDGALPGIIMEAQPRVGDAYKQECAPGVAEDEAEVLKLNHTVKTPVGKFGHTLLTRESTPLEPDVAETKAYAQCLGLVRTEIVKGGKGVISLVKAKNEPSRAELGCKDKKKKHDQKHKRHKHRRHH